MCITTGMTAMGQARGWRGFVPLHSTRADVERLLGPPTEILNKYSVFYRTANETLIFGYASGLPCGIGEKYSQWRVPKDTVESILMTPIKGVTLSELAIDPNKFEKRSGGHTAEEVYYINDQDGESIRVFLGEVRGISLYPGRVDAHLGCPGLQLVSGKSCEGLTPPSFDSYGKVPLQQEKWHLDSFAIALMGDRGKTGYIIAYAGKRAGAGEAKQRAKRAKNYMVSVRSFAPSRIQAIDGGYREEPEVELYVVPRVGCTPTPSPTVDPRDVHLIKSKEKNSRRS